LCWPEVILTLFYSQSSPYIGLAQALRVAAIASLFAYLAGILAALLMSLEENRKVFLSQLISVVGFGLGVPLGVGFGVAGAYLAILSTYLIRSVLTVAQVAQIWRRSSGIDLRPPAATTYAS
jgi:O-antigen/teichoic acid export membrane protein